MKKVIHSAVASMLMVVGSASADVTINASNNVTILNGSGELFPNIFVYYVINTNPGGGAISFNSDENDDFLIVVLVDDPSTTDIVAMSVIDNGGRSSLAGVLQVFVANPAQDSLSITQLQLDGSIGIPGDPNAGIYVNEITGGISIGGDVYSDIEVGSLGASGAPMSFFVVDGNVDNASVINNVNDINVVNIMGDVISTTDTAEIAAEGTIGSLSVGGNFNGKIGSSLGGFSGSTTLGNASVVGDFSSPSMMTLDSIGNLFIGGDYEADIELLNPLLSNSTINVGGQFVDSPASAIRLPGAGLNGSIVFNAENTGDWLGLGQIHIGSGTALSNGYTELSEELGGGAAGLAPFNFHQRTTAPNINPTTQLEYARDCDPFHTEVISIPAGNPNSLLAHVDISHYGDVYIDVAGSKIQPGEHFYVEYKPDFFSGAPQWQDRSDLFTVSSAGTDPNTAQQKIRIAPISTNTAGFVASGRWRITPKDQKVLSAGVPVDPYVVYDSSVTGAPVDGTAGSLDWYSFRVRLQAPAP